MQVVLRLFPEPGAAAGPEDGDTAGLEAYLRVFARHWELLGAGDAPVYTTGDRAKDSRLKELEHILLWVRMWMEYNIEADHGSDALNRGPNRSSRGVSHQLFFDIQSNIQATLDFLADVDARYPAGFAILMRKICQDSLENFFNSYGA